MQGSKEMGGEGVGLLVEFKNKFLLLKRKETGIWELCKGHLEIVECYEEAIKRELFEETGIERSSSPKKIGALTFSFISKKTNKIKTREIKYYHINVYTSNVILSDEHTDCLWLEKKFFLEKLAFEDVRNVMKHYFA